MQVETACDMYPDLHSVSLNGPDMGMLCPGDNTGIHGPLGSVLQACSRLRVVHSLH